jgi:hypothetical protein
LAGTLTGYYPSGVPTCGINTFGAVTFNVLGGNNTWYAQATSGGAFWSGGTFYVGAGECQTIQLQ